MRGIAATHLGQWTLVIFDSRSRFPGPGTSGEALEFSGDRDVFVWDRVANVTRRISLGVGGVEPDGESFAGDISRDGSYAVFISNATNLVATPSLVGAPLKLRAYWIDLRPSAATKLVYEGTATNARDTARHQARITSSGRYVVAGVEVTDGFGPTSLAVNWDALTDTTGYAIEDYWQGRYTFAMTSDRRRVAGVGHPSGPN